MQRVRTVIFVFMFFPALSLDTPHSPLSFDHFVRSHQHVGRNCEADLIRGFQVDDEFKLGLLPSEWVIFA